MTLLNDFEGHRADERFTEILDATRTRSDEARRRLADVLYDGGNVMLYGSTWLAWR